MLTTIHQTYKASLIDRWRRHNKSEVLVYVNMENTTLLVNCKKCKANNNDNNDNGDSNADWHVCQLPGLQAQLVSSYQVSTVNSMTGLKNKHKIIGPRP